MKIYQKSLFQLNGLFALVLTFVVSSFSFSSSMTKPAQAQEVLQKIEALVNDDIISWYDLDQRLNLIIAASASPPSPEEQEVLKKQVLRSMVDERLQLQEAQEFDVEIDVSQLEDAFRNISNNFEQTPEQFEQFLVNSGSSKKSLFEQLRAEFSWQAIVNGRLGGQVNISDEDVEDRIARIIANKGKYEYRIAEIYLIVDNPSRRSQVMQTADRLHEQIIRGTQFYILARQFSETSSASSGGDMGWVAEDQLSREIKDVVSQMTVGTVSIPIFSGSGYHILNLLDRRRILSVDPMDVEIELHSMFYQFNEETTQEETEAWLQNAETVMPTMNSCEQIEAFSAQLDITEFGQIANIPLRQLNPRLKPLIVPLEVGQPTQPIVSGDGVRFFIICNKTTPEIVEPTFEQVFDKLEQERLALMARRYLRDIRRDSIVDYK
jgi:peptidyl-prolyl cis-trans isomerase SurA